MPAHNEAVHGFQWAVCTLHGFHLFPFFDHALRVQSIGTHVVFQLGPAYETSIATYC